MKSLLTIAATTLLLSSLVLLNQNQEQHPFKQWQNQYNKFYSSAEESYRLQIFNKNLERIQTHNANPNKTYRMAINQFADLSDEEFESMYLNKGTYVNTENIVESQTVKLIPVDWSSKMNAIKNQGQCGSCWTFSAIGAVEAALIIKKSFKGILAEQQLVDCAKAAGDGCNGGNSDLALDYLVTTGAVYEADYPYTATDGVCQVKKGKVFISARQNYDFNEDNIKNGIQAYPLSVSVDATNWKFYADGIFSGDCRDDYHNHAVVAVGYDQDGNWKIRNSWGEGWGLSGHMYLKTGNTCAVMTRVDGAIA